MIWWTAFLAGVASGIVLLTVLAIVMVAVEKKDNKKEDGK